MKTWMKVVLGGVAVLGLLFGLVFWITGGAADASDDFFAKVQKGEMDQAYELLTEDFQAGTPKDQLQRFLTATALDRVVETSWSSRSIENNVATLKGSVTTDTGGVIPVTVVLVNSDAGWKIQGIEKEKGGLSYGTDAPTLPSEAEQVEIVRATTNDFIDSMRTRDMTGFLAQSSLLLQTQISVEEMNQSFAERMGPYSKLDMLRDMAPSFAIPVSLDNQGILVVLGYYNTEPDRYEFRYRYVREGTQWKLLGISNRIVPSSGDFAPFSPV
ncbi:MAG: hypothetical protein AAF067_09375 [Pseudomonadota bacterium]